MMDPENLPKFVYLHKSHKYRLKLGFYAAPSNPKAFSKAVRDQLDKLKFTYCTELNGFVMGFGKISSNEVIPADVRYCISVAVNVDVYIFRPPVGSIIEAIVNQTSENHVSCLVHKLFNVSIVRPEHQPYNQWSGSKIKKDDEINVKVLSFDLAKKLPHITGEIVENKNQKFCNSKDEQKHNSSNYSSSEESINSLTKPMKQDSVCPSEQSSSDSESSRKSNSMQKASSKKYFYEPIKSCPQGNHSNNSQNNCSQLIKSPLGSSTPMSNSEHSVGSIDLIRTKQLKQLHKHLAKNVVHKQKSMSLDKAGGSIEKDHVSSLSDICLSSKPIGSKCKIPVVSISNTDYSDDANNFNSPDNAQSDSGISNDDRRQIKSAQNRLSTSKSSPKSIKKLNSSEKNVGKILNSSSPSKVKSGTKPTYPNVFIGSDTDYNNKCEDNSVYTQHMIQQENKNSTYSQSIHNLVNLNNSDEDSSNKYKSPNKSRIHKLNLSTGSVKPKNSPRKIELKASKNENKNDRVKLQSNSMFSMISDEDSSSSGNELSVSHMNHKVEFNKETENNTISTLPASKSISTAQYTSSSDDEVYTKLKQNISNMESSKPCEEKKQNLNNIYSSNDTDSDLSSIPDTSNLKMIKPKILPIKSVNMSVSDKDDFSNELPYNKSKNKKKQLNEKSLLLPTSKYSNNKNKSFPDLCNKKNNVSEIIKQISKDSSCNDSINIKMSNIKSTLSTSNSEGTIKPTIQTDFSNPFVKLCTANSISSSSEDQDFDTDLKINQSSKKFSTSLHTNDGRKNALIQQFLTAVKDRDEKNEQKLITHDTYSNPPEIKTISIVEEFKKKKSKRKNKSNKNILKCFKNPIEKPNMPSINKSQKSNPLQLQIKSSTDDSTDDEVDFIKRFLEKRKLIKNHELKSTSKKNNPENLNKLTKPIEKIYDNLKSRKSSDIKTNELINKIIKLETKQLEETKNLHSDSYKELSSTVQNYNLSNSSKVSQSFEKVHKKSKSPNLSLDKTNEFNITKTNKIRPTNSKDLILEKVLSGFGDSFSSMDKRNSIQLHVLSKTLDKKNQKCNAQIASTVINKSINNVIKKKKKKSKETKDLLVDRIINSLDVSSTKKNHYPTQLKEISEKKNEKFKPQIPSMIETHELINKHNIKTKQKKSKKNKDLLSIHNISSKEDFSSSINNSTKLNTGCKTSEKNKKLKPTIASRILTDQLGSDTQKTQHKELNNLFIDSITSNVDNSTRLNELSETHRTKNKKSKFQKSLVTNDLVVNTLKTKEEKSKKYNLFSDSINKSIAGSSGTQNKKRSKDCLQNSMTDSPDNGIPSKKRKKDHYLITDKTNENELKIEDSVSLTEVRKKKKKKKEFNKSDLNSSSVNRTTSPVESKKKEKNTFIDDRKQKKKKMKMLPNDDLEDINPTKPESINKKSKKLLMNKFKKFLSTQNDYVMNDLDKLYHSINMNQK